jgi:xylulokinase
MGVDIGTTGSRALLINETGKIVAEASAGYPILTPYPNWAEQDPKLWWTATQTAVTTCLDKARQVVGKESIEVGAIGLTGQMHGAVFLDEHGDVLRNAIIWCDQRTAAQCDEICETVGKTRLLELTSNRALTGFTAPKVLWMRRYEPQLYESVRQVLLPKDYVRYRMTGEFATDVSDASGTLLFDVTHRTWSDEMLVKLNIPREWFPKCHESPEIASCLSRKAATQLGLRPGTPVVAGAGDQAAGAVGNGIVTAGRTSCVLGTSGVVFWPSESPVMDPEGRLHSFCHAVPGKWHLMGVTLAAGGSLRWFRDTLCQYEVATARDNDWDPYDLITLAASSVTPGCEGLVFLPYLAGERTPHAAPNARGAFLGLSLRHGKAHMARSVLEGVAFSLRDCVELGSEMDLKSNQVYVSGGGARSVLWRDILANVLDVQVVRTAVDEGPAYGAAILAAVGAGAFESVEQACEELIQEVNVDEPDPEMVRIYDALYEIYNPLYSTLRGFYESTAEFVSNWSQ